MNQQIEIVQKYWDKEKFLTEVRTIGESRIPKKKNQEEGNIEIFGINYQYCYKN